jgi:hypothetical protein
MTVLLWAIFYQSNPRIHDELIPANQRRRRSTMIVDVHTHTPTHIGPVPKSEMRSYTGWGRFVGYSSIIAGDTRDHARKFILFIEYKMSTSHFESNCTIAGFTLI